jgi:hypothetical protein
MLLQIARETMVAFIVAHEIEEVSVCGIHGSLQRSHSGVGDWTRWQSGKLIRVIRRVKLQVRDIDGAAIPPGKQGRIDHAGIGSQSHVFSQPIVIDAGNQRPFLRIGCLLFHDRSHGHDAMHVGITQQPDLLRLLPEAMHHGGRYVVGSVDASELVGVGKEISFQRLGIGIEVADEEDVAAGGGQEVGGGPSPACSTAAAMSYMLKPSGTTTVRA